MGKIRKTSQSGLIANPDYKATQFGDFYDLDTDNFDTQQQKIAQHLIGYPKRKYLENIITDDVSVQILSRLYPKTKEQKIV